MKSVMCAAAGLLAVAGCLPKPAVEKPVAEKPVEATVFVSPDGSDANPGTREKPVATPYGARAVARKQLAAGRSPVVEFADGVYAFPEPLVLGPEDSGLHGTSAVWRAAHRGRAVFTGAMKLAWKPLDDAKIVALLPPSASGKTLVADIPGKGDLPSFRNGHYKTPQDDIPMALFAGDERLVCARWPNDRFARTGKVKSEKVGLGERAKNPGFFAFDRDKLAQWAKEPFAWTFGLWGVEWADAVTPLTGIDLAAGEVRLEKEAILFGLKRGMPFYVFNCFCEMDRPGEWVVDRARRRVYLYRPEAKPLPHAVVADGLVKGDGLGDFVFDGFVFEMTRKEAISLAGCERVTVRASIVRHTCSWGVHVTGGRDCRVVGCDLHDLGEGGICLKGGEQKTLSASRHVAENCHVHHYGRTIYNYREGIALYGTGNRAVHNLVHHAYHTGIYFQGNDHYVGYNVVHDVCEFNDDAGAIYCWQYSWLKRGGTVEHNVVHMVGKKKNPSNTEGIYLDDFTSEVVVRGNLINRTTCGIKLGGGQSHAVTGNVVMNSTRPINLDSRAKWPDPPQGRRSKLWKEIDADRKAYDSPLWRGRYPGFARLLDYAGDAVSSHLPFWGTVSNNVFVACGEPRRMDWEMISNATVWAANVSVTNDPGFVDYAGLDWRAREGGRFAAAIAGCRFVEAGLYDSPDRISPAVKFGEGVMNPFAFGGEKAVPPASVNLAVTLDGTLPEGLAGFAKDTVDCSVQSWSKGRWIFAREKCDPDAAAPWQEYAYSFVPTCDCQVKFVAMGGYGVKTMYDDVKVTGATWTGDLFAKPQPILGNEKDRTISTAVRLRKGVLVTVSFRAKAALE